MRSRRLLLGAVLGLLSIMVMVGPTSAAVSFQPGEIDGVWMMTAFGAYDVRGVSYYGRITFSEGTLVSGTGGNNGNRDHLDGRRLERQRSSARGDRSFIRVLGPPLSR